MIWTLLRILFCLWKSNKNLTYLSNDGLMNIIFCKEGRIKYQMKTNTSKIVIFCRNRIQTPKCCYHAITKFPRFLSCQAISGITQLEQQSQRCTKIAMAINVSLTGTFSKSICSSNLVPVGTLDKVSKCRY